MKGSLDERKGGNCAQKLDVSLGTPLGESGVVSLLPFKSHHDSGLAFSVIWFGAYNRICTESDFICTLCCEKSQGGQRSMQGVHPEVHLGLAEEYSYSTPHRWDMYL